MARARRLIAGRPIRRNPFYFLHLPGETRNQIYRDLFGEPAREVGDWHENELCDTSRVFNHKRRLGGNNYSGLLALMRTCRSLYREVSAFLYHQGRFTLSTLAMASNIYFLLHGPGRHLRSVAVQFRESRLPAAHWPLDVWEPIGDLPYEGRLLRAIAEKARRLEHLEIQTCANQHPHIPKGYVFKRWGVAVEFPEYSWIDPPIRLTGLSAGEIPRYPTEEQLVAMLEHLAPGDDGKQVLMRGLIGYHFRPDESPSFWNMMRHELRQTTEQQLFWQQMISVFEDMSPTLRTLDWVGVVDRKWMAALADVMNVTVRGRLTGNSDNWVTVEPSSLASTE
ncbi:hypothetical protein B0T25DRAFT_572634 [Lasiosphaeria hispida]|uniref:Uncharacterized protein n=1 Tax=Lasiosphaeria hispida TaxID=260671 RepID=A0AAJ0H8E1_9PEZI|nr:hypothetical protein B0T25DRAFT_572634 [Lasiosphaeria hispida]